MKKILLYLLLFSGSLTVTAQYSVRNWEKKSIVSGTTPVPSNGYSWFTTAGNMNSCAYNPITDKLYVANRGVNIYIIDPATGAEVGTLLKSTPAPAGFYFNKVRVTPTGEIYAITLKTSTTIGDTFVYYWASETATPVLLGHATTGIALLNERAGDSFAVTGSGADVVLYVGGNAAAVTGPPAIPAAVNLQVVKKSGTDVAVTTDFAKISNITVTTSAARTSIAPVTTGTSSDIWISGPTVAKRLITSAGVETKVLASTTLTAPGTYTVTAAGSISNKFAVMEYFEIGPKKFLAATGGNDSPFSGEGVTLHIYDVTDVNAIVLIETTKLSYTYVSNANATADIAMKKVVNGDGSIDMTFFQLINNNGLASYTLNFKADGTLPVALSAFNASIINGSNTLNWTTTSESNNAGFEIESSQDGASFSKIGFVASKALNNNSSVALTYSFSDRKALSGTTYYRLKQLDLDGQFKHSEIKAINNSLVKDAVFSVFPNPTTNYVDVVSPLADLNGYEYVLFSANGKKIKTQGLKSNTQLSLSGLNPAIYILKITKDNQTVQSVRIVKQ